MTETNHSSSPDSPDAACERCALLLPGAWSNDPADGLTDSERAELAAHLAACPACAELERLWHDLGSLPQIPAPVAADRRFMLWLAGEEAAQRRTASSPSGIPAWDLRGWALAASFLILALGVGWWLRGRVALRPGNEESEIAALRQQMNATEKLTILSLLEQQSVNRRLEGVSFSYRLNQPDAQVVEALVHSLDADPSPEVRLAALDALEDVSQQSPQRPAAAAVKQQLVQAFDYQNSPLVQAALVDSLCDLKPAAARPLLEKLSRDAQLDPAVRQRAARGLAQWN